MLGPPNMSIRSDCVVTFFFTVAVTVPYDRLLGFSAVPAAGLSTRSLGGGVLSAHPPNTDIPTTRTAPRAINRCISRSMIENSFPPLPAQMMRGPDPTGAVVHQVCAEPFRLSIRAE